MDDKTALLDESMVTLEECSKSDDGTPVTRLQYKVYKFDRLSQREADRFRNRKKLRSADGVYVDAQDRYYFFEFKNVPRNHMPFRELYAKAHDSLLIWQVINNRDCSLENIAQRSSFFVIYNDNAPGQRENAAPSVDKMRDKLKDMAKITERHPVLWNLEVYKGEFYREVYTLDISEFERDFAGEIFGGEL